jgi:hypothetical protein
MVQKPRMVIFGIKAMVKLVDYFQNLVRIME